MFRVIWKKTLRSGPFFEPLDLRLTGREPKEGAARLDQNERLCCRTPPKKIRTTKHAELFKIESSHSKIQPNWTTKGTLCGFQRKEF